MTAGPSQHDTDRQQEPDVAAMFPYFSRTTLLMSFSSMSASDVFQRVIMMGSRKSFTLSARKSALTRVKQQISPSFSQLIRASLSPVPIFARSRSSLGRTICPRSSMPMRDSIRQRLVSLSDVRQQASSVFFFTMGVAPRKRFFILIYQRRQNNQKKWMMSRIFSSSPPAWPIGQKDCFRTA